MRAGDRAAENDLFLQVQDRLKRLARRMLRSFPAVRRLEQTSDVLQDGLLTPCASFCSWKRDGGPPYINGYHPVDSERPP
jgi:DNA-directed RNA polymerase specialized sigma24 family protein